MEMQIDSDLIKNLIEKANTLADFSAIFVPAGDSSEDETNKVYNDFIDALDAVNAIISQ